MFFKNYIRQAVARQLARKVCQYDIILLLEGLKMKVGLYVIHDKVANDYSQIFQAKTHGVALRNFEQAMRNNERKDEFRLLQVAEADILNEEDSIDLLTPVVIKSVFTVIIDGEDYKTNVEVTE